jgi:hypothetical protein
MAEYPTNNKIVALRPPPVPRSPSSKAQLRALIDSLFNAEVETLVTTALALAKGGVIDGVVRAPDPTLLKWAIDRVSPPPRGSPVELPDMPPIRSVEDALTALGSLCTAVAQGQVSVETAQGVAALLQQFISAADTTQLVRRLELIEQRIEEARGLNPRRDPEW